MKMVDCPRCGGTGKTPDQTAIGLEMRNLRLAAGITLHSVAEKLHFSSPYLSDLEKGHRTWSNQMVEDYRKAIR